MAKSRRSQHVDDLKGRVEAGVDTGSSVGQVWQTYAVEYWQVDRPRVNHSNPRTHSDRQIAQLAASIRRFGFYAPIVVDESGQILAGHGRREAALQLGMQQVPVISVTHLAAAEKHALAIAENRVAELAGWDDDLLAIEIATIEALDPDLDIEITGFDTVDIDRLKDSRHKTRRDDVADSVPPIGRDKPTVSRPGDLWLLGKHRLACANALDAHTYTTLLTDGPAQLTFTDPPYNVPLSGNVTGKGRARHREFAMASGEMTPDEFTVFLRESLARIAGASANGAIVFVCMDWRHQAELLSAARPTFDAPKNMCVWVKSNAGMGTFYRSAHELIYVFKNGSGRHINNFGLGERGRFRTNVWHYPGLNSFGRQRDEQLAMHPTVKPVAMVADAIRDCSRREGIVLDPFGGSGTTLIAAERTHRRSRLIELDPRYVDVAIRRWQELTGNVARHAAADRSFEEMAADRATASMVTKVSRRRTRRSVNTEA